MFPGKIDFTNLDCTNYIGRQNLYLKTELGDSKKISRILDWQSIEKVNMDKRGIDLDKETGIQKDWCN